MAENTADDRQRSSIAGRQLDLAALFDDAVTGMAIVDLDGRFAAVNPALCRLLGYSEAELVTRSPVDITHPDDRPRSLAVMDRLVSGEDATDQIHKRYIRADGSVVSVLRTTTVIRDTDGAARGLFTQAVDVTAITEMQEAIGGSKRRFEALVAHAYDLILLLDPIGRITYASPAAERVLGYEPEQLGGRAALGFVHPDDREAARRVFAERSGAAGPVEPAGYRVRHSDGSWRDVEVVATSGFDDPTVATVVLNVRDVTEQVGYQRRLEMGERRFRTLVANSWDMISLHDTEGRYVYCSPAAAQLGYDPDDLIGTSPRELIHADDRAGVGEAFAQVLGLDSRSVTFEYRVSHRDGSLRWVESIAQNRLADPAIASVVVTTRDISQRRLRARQQQAVAELAQDALRGGPVEHLLEKIPATVADALAVADCRVVRFEADGTTTLMSSAHPDRSRRDQAGHPACTVAVTPATGRSGMLAVYGCGPNGFGADEMAFLESVASILASALSRRNVEEELRHQAVHDRLTDLPNRALLKDRLETALARLSRRSGRVAVLFVDLDNFKLINDSLGHTLGDSVVAAVAERLRGAVRHPDTVARFGGDEFVIVIESDEPSSIEHLADRIRRAIAAPMTVADRTITVTASIGFASTAERSTSADSLLADADMAMYEAKAAGKDSVARFTAEMRHRTSRHLETVSGIGRGIEAGEFLLHYQPIFDLATGQVETHEALLRWQHPTSGLLLPSQFIGYAEASDLIIPLGRWVLDTGCNQSATWRRAGRPAKVSMNVSGRQLTGADVAGDVAAALQRNGADPSDIYLEVTETALISDRDRARAALVALRDLGVHLGLDDFGTGWSSLSQLAHLPFDFVKIDQSFVRDLESDRRKAALLESILALCSTLGLRVIVEGVETASQLEHLQRLGVRLAQGFLLGRPVPPERTVPTIPLWRPHRGRGGQAGSVAARKGGPAAVTMPPQVPVTATGRAASA